MAGCAAAAHLRLRSLPCGLRFCSQGHNSGATRQWSPTPASGAHLGPAAADVVLMPFPAPKSCASSAVLRLSRSACLATHLSKNSPRALSAANPHSEGNASEHFISH